MRRGRKRQSSHSQWEWSELLNWSLVIAALVAVAWIWWRAGHAPTQPGNTPLTPKKGPAISGARPTTQIVAASTQRVDAVQPETALLKEKHPVPANEPLPSTNVPESTTPSPTPASSGYPRRIQSVLEAQLALARLGISSGSLDGVMGSQTRTALRAFQRDQGLPVTGALDRPTLDVLTLDDPPFTTYIVAAEDLARLQPLSRTWLGKSQQSALEYETLLELVAEKSQSNPGLIRQLNPDITWGAVPVGTWLRVPDVSSPEVSGKAAFAVISLSERSLEAFDAETNLLAHFPCSIAQRVEKRPVGELHVAVVAPHPNYTFDPEVFPESAEGRQLNRKLVLPPGPNNPVGSVWIGLDKPGYGIHGTPNPEQVGRTESHGCFRLANWNADYLVQLVWIGLPVYVIR